MPDYDDYDDFEWDEHEDLHNLVQEIRNEMANMPKERPIFSDKQILAAEDLQVGKHYKHYHKNECCEQILMTEPYKHKEEPDAWFIKVWSVAYDFEYEQSLADCSIIPYTGGGWNDTNYMTEV